jgi:FlaG/FlaF family flagellin (archaellin)
MLFRKMIMHKKRGLSPVVATTLLISLALILALIIFFWAREFIGGQLQKEGVNIEAKCEQISFTADAFSDKIVIVNTGNVPIYGIKVQSISGGDISEIARVLDSTINNGETSEVLLDDSLIPGDEIVVIPILLGELEEKKSSHECDRSFGVEIVVRAA